MKQTVFHVAQMDCPSEEALIRMKLGGLAQVVSLGFDLGERRLTVVQSGDVEAVAAALDSLDLGASLLESAETVSDGRAAETQTPEAERRLLRQVLAVNLFFFLLEAGAGLAAHSMSLLGDSLDMLADTLVYALALAAAGGSAALKKNTAKAAGALQLALAVWGFAEVVQRFLLPENTPDFRLMMGVSLLALAGNVWCLRLLQQSRSREAHMRAGMIFTSNDVVVNLGVIAAGALTLLTGSAYPDLAVGIIVFGLVGRGALKIFRLAR